MECVMILSILMLDEYKHFVWSFCVLCCSVCVSSEIKCWNSSALNQKHCQSFSVIQRDTDFFIVFPQPNFLTLLFFVNYFYFWKLDMFVFILDFYLQIPKIHF